MTDHMGEEQLQQFADGELVEASVRQHVEACGECAGRLREIAQAGEAYRAVHEETKAQDPPPPRPWADLRPAISPRRTSWRVWAGAAAVVMIAVAGYYRMSRPAPVSAAELLRKAAAAERPSSATRRIRVKTAKREIVRPALVAAPAAGELEALFLAAGFSWQDPLSARSFSSWRERLSDKRDTVRQEPGRYEIETTTTDGPLRSATIVLDGELRAVRETLEFTGERVEIAEAEAEPQPVIAKPSLAARLPEPPPEPGPATELRVIAALHAIAADLGEPIQVKRDESGVLVTATGLTPAREREVREAVAGIPGAVYRAVETPPADARGSAPADAVVRPPPSQLVGILGEDGVNRILDASEAVMARVFALRGLSRRFPHAVEAQLADADRDVLASIRGEHVAGIRRHVAGLRSSVAPLLPKTAEADTAPAGDWHAKAERLFTAAQAVDHLLNRVLAGGQDFTRLAPDLADALGRLEAEARE